MCDVIFHADDDHFFQDPKLGPVVFTADSANELFVRVSNYMLTHGRVRTARELKTVEIQNAWLVLTNPKNSVVTIKSRDLSFKYLQAEMDWYESGSPNVTDIGTASSFWYKLADTNGTVNSNYGKLVLQDKWAGKSQLEWCIDSLITDPDSRQAVLNYNQPVHKHKGNKDFVCTLTQQFMLVDGRLNSTVHMRSNDLIYGASYDIPWFTSMQARVADALNVPMGVYNHIAASLHVYERHFKMLEAMAHEDITTYA